MDRAELARRLREIFVAELEDHVHSLGADLLALEREADAGARAERVRSLFRVAHSLKGAARAVQLGAVEVACHHVETVLAAIRDGRRTLDPSLLELLLALTDALAATARALREGSTTAGDEVSALLPRLLETAGGDPAGAPASPSPFVGTSPAAPPPEPTLRVASRKLDALLADLGALQHARRGCDQRTQTITSLQQALARWRREWRRADPALRALVRRDRARIAHASSSREQRLLHRTGVAVLRTRQSLTRFEHELESLRASLAADARRLGQVGAVLEANVRSARLVPFAEVGAGLERVVRDVAVAQGKRAELVVEGGALEVDRALREQLHESLAHLVSNAVVHGIETPEGRLGKGAFGRVTVRAEHANGWLRITVEDDGRGVDVAAVRARARHLGLPEPPDDDGALRLVLAAGLSTSPGLDTVSGRGVGLDAVRARVESLRGRVEIASAEGRGARFSLSLPLTRATLSTIVLQAGGQTFLLPTSFARRVLRVGGDTPVRDGRRVLAVDDELLPEAPLAEVLGIAPRDAPPSGPRRQALVVDSGARAAVVVDAVHGEREVVLQGLGPRLGFLRAYVGAALLADGRTALVLNGAELVRRAALLADRGAPG